MLLSSSSSMIWDFTYFPFEIVEEVGPILGRVGRRDHVGYFKDLKNWPKRDFCSKLQKGWKIYWNFNYFSKLTHYGSKIFLLTYLKRFKWKIKLHQTVSYLKWAHFAHFFWLFLKKSCFGWLFAQKSFFTIFFCRIIESDFSENNYSINQICTSSNVITAIISEFFCQKHVFWGFLGLIFFFEKNSMVSLKVVWKNINFQCLISTDTSQPIQPWWNPLLMFFFIHSK